GSGSGGSRISSPTLGVSLLPGQAPAVPAARGGQRSHPMPEAPCMRSHLARTLPLALLLLVSLAPGSPARAAPVFTRLGATAARVLAATSATTGVPVRAGEGATLLAVDADAIAGFRAARGGQLAVPDAGGGSV